ncbi:MAG TPA: hypothetical protein PKX93_05830, partial [bacterium]|nr:hypothetical protein [bacterium]
MNQKKKGRNRLDLTWPEIVAGFRQIPFPHRLGLLLALVHFTLFVLIVSFLVIIPGQPRWRLAWSILLLIDFPVSLMLAPFLFCCPDITFSHLIYPLTHLKTFWLPFSYLGLLGTAW